MLEQALLETAPELSGGRDKLPFVFVIGCPRSGTTLLQRMLDNHPMLTVSNDTHFIPSALRGFSDEVNPSLTPEFVERVRTYRRFYRLKISDEAVDRAAEGATNYREFVGGLYLELARSKGKPFAGEKTPDYVRHIPRLHELCPSAKFIHIIRDGRDVALSTLQWANEKKGPGKLPMWGKEPLGTCALWWSRMVTTGRRGGETIERDTYCEVRYEDLVAEPERELRLLSSFLDLPYSEDMAAFHRGKTKSNPNLSAKSAWLPATQGLRDWKSQMDNGDTELFEALAGPLLAELGYETLGRSASPETSQRAAWCRESWERDKK